MEKMRLVLGFSLLLTLLSLDNVAAGVPWDDAAVTITSTACSTPANGCVKFQILFREIDTDLATFRSFKYALFFGDYSYVSGIYTLPTSANGVNTEGILEIQHQFNGAFSSQGYLEAVPAYNDKEKPKKFMFNNNANGSVLPSEPVMVPTPTEDLEIIPIFDPRKGDRTTYIVSFVNNCSTTLENQTLTLNFPRDSVILEQVIVPEANNILEFGDLDNENDQSYTDVKFLNIPPGKRINCFFQFKIKDNVNTNDVIKLTAKLDVRSEGLACAKKNTFVVLTAKDSHDPNKISADRSNLCPTAITSSDSVTYQIIFQNTGSRAAYTVVVTDYLPDVYLLEKVKVKKPIGISGSIKNFMIDTTTREMTWVLQRKLLRGNTDEWPEQLRGTNEPGYGDSIFDYHTKDTIEFTVFFDPDKRLASCGSIINQAEIVFDNNSPIITNTFSTQLQCNSCTPCQNLKSNGNAFSFEINKGEAIRLEIPSNLASNFDEINWYPSYGLDNSKSSNPLASPQKSTVYTVTLSKDCVSQQFIYKVVVKSSGNGNIILCIAGGILAVFLAIALFIIKKMKSKNQT